MIDGASNTTVSVAVGQNPVSLAVNPATNKIYVACLNDGLTVIDGATNGTVFVAAGDHPSAVAVNPSTNRVYVANYDSANVTVVNGATNSTNNVSVGSNPDGIAVNPVTNKIYVALATNLPNVTVIDGLTNSTTNLDAADGPIALAVNPETNKIYVLNYNSNNVTVFDGTTNTSTNVSAGTNPYALAVDSVTNKIYVVNKGSNNVTVIDGATNSTTTVSAGAAPASLAIDPVLNIIYVANRNSNDLTTIIEQPIYYIPLPTTIAPLGNGTFRFTPLFVGPFSLYPDAPHVFFQVDTWQGQWNSAAPSGNSFLGTLPPLRPGFHSLYAYATDSQLATSDQVGSTLIGEKAQYGFLVTQTTAASRDFVGNGDSDALLYDPATGTAYTALNNGLGSYQYVYNLFTSAFDVLRTGDFNGDGAADLVVYNSHTALGYIGFGKGDGTFAFQSLFWSPAITSSNRRHQWRRQE